MVKTIIGVVVGLGTSVFMEQAIKSVVKKPNSTVVKILFGIGASAVSGLVSYKVSEHAKDQFERLMKKSNKD